MDEARAALADAFPDRRVRVIERVQRGNRKRTYRAAVDGRAVVVQLGARASGGLGAEPLVARAVAERTDVPVPRVLATGAVDGVEYVASERAPGADLHERIAGLAPAVQRRVVRSLGRFLGAIHAAFAFDDVGPVGVADGRLAVTDPRPDWPAYLRELVETGLARPGTPLSGLADRVRATVARAGDRLPPHPPATLFPWDVRPGNALVDDGTVTALLDWGEPLAAPAECSLAKAEYVTVDWYFEDRPGVRVAFHEGYRERAPLAPDYFTRRRRYYRLAAVVRAAVDSKGEVTRPRYPMVPPEAAAAFHRDHVRALTAVSGG
jgi:Ser/Thr protein kinase RdoA (MazF antagonist)